MNDLNLLQSILVGKWDTTFGVIQIELGEIIGKNAISGKVHTTIENSDYPSGIYDYTLKSINNKYEFHFSGLKYIFDVTSLGNTDSLILIEAETNHALILIRASN